MFSGKNMSDNQNINVKNPISFSRQGVSQISTTESDSQMIDDVLKELEGQETEQKEVNSQNIIDSLVEEVGTIGSEGRLPDDLPTSRQDSGEVKPVSAEDYGVVKKETENFGGKNSQFLEPLKNPERFRVLCADCHYSEHEELITSEKASR